MGVLRAFPVNLGLSGHAFCGMGARNVPESRVPFTDEQIRECLLFTQMI